MTTCIISSTSHDFFRRYECRIRTPLPSNSGVKRGENFWWSRIKVFGNGDLASEHSERPRTTWFRRRQTFQFQIRDHRSIITSRCEFPPVITRSAQLTLGTGRDASQGELDQSLWHFVQHWIHRCTTGQPHVAAFGPHGVNNRIGHSIRADVWN
jgi:hypothetical protein